MTPAGMPSANPSITQRTCCAHGCEELVPTKHLMCLRHWTMVPAETQTRVCQALKSCRSGGSYRPYLIARLKAILAVATAEDAEPTVRLNLQEAVVKMERPTLKEKGKTS